MLNYIDIIIKKYALGLSGAEIARQLKASKSGVNDFLSAFENCEKLSYPLPKGITNYAIAELVYGKANAADGGRDTSYSLPDFAEVARQMRTRQSMTLIYQWNIYVRKCQNDELKPYQYRQFCELFNKWCDENYETAHFNAVIGQSMEVDFAGHTFSMVNRLTGEIYTIVVFVAVLPYSQYTYAEGMLSTKEPQWIAVNNHALKFFGGVPALVVCDNCKQAVIANKDWIEPELNADYAEWAEHNHTAILPAKVRHPKFKSSVECAVGILEKGLFHDLEEMTFFSLEQFNEALWERIDELNEADFKNKEHCRYYYWKEEKTELMPLPSVQYEYTERSTAKVSGDYHVRFDNAYYSVDKAYLHKKVSIRATATTVSIYSIDGQFIRKWPRARYRGQWQTDNQDLPENHRGCSEWNRPYFMKKALSVGPKTADVIQAVLNSKTIEVQTYRLCIGILNYTRKYSKQTLEECCRRALDIGKPSYSFIKNTITSVAAELGENGFNTDTSNKRNQGAYAMEAKAIQTDTLLARSQALAEKARKEADRNA